MAPSTTSSGTQAGQLDLDEKTAHTNPKIDNSLVEKGVPTSPSVSGGKASSTTSNSGLPTDSPGPPPDGGLEAWLQVLVAALVCVNTWGHITAFGVFQTYYLTILPQSSSDIAWIGSLQVFLLFGLGTFSGRAIDAGYYRYTSITGSFLILFGVFMTSLCTKYWQLLLAQGLCMGIGNGLLFCPAMANISTYFTKHRAMALALAATGTTTGGVVIPGIFEGLINRIGFGWTLRVLGLIMLVLQIIALAITRTRVRPRSIGPLIDFAAFKEMPYLLFAVGMFFCFWGVYVAFWYIGEYASSVIKVSQANSINLLILMNGIGLIGRIAPGYISDKWTGPTNLLIPLVLLSAITLYCWAAIFSAGGLWAFATVYGLFSSGFFSLFPTALSTLNLDITKAGVRMGMIFTVVSFATLTGTPIAGALISADGGDYLGMEMFSASLLMIGALLLVAARISRTGWKLNVRV